MDTIATAPHTHTFSITRSFQRHGEPKRLVSECEICGQSVLVDAPVDETVAA